MFLEKIQNNERGHSALNFVVIMFMFICLCCAVLDLTNMVRIKSVVNQQANTCAFAATMQSGFKRTEPKDWQDFYGTGKYLTTPKLVSDQKYLFSKTTALTWKTSLGDKTISSAGDTIISWKEESKLKVEATYQFKYLNAFGLINSIYKYENVQDVVGFWVHKTTSI